VTDPGEVSLFSDRVDVSGLANRSQLRKLRARHVAVAAEPHTDILGFTQSHARKVIQLHELWPFSTFQNRNISFPILKPFDESS
jgi:hypothetical protein